MNNDLSSTSPIAPDTETPAASPDANVRQNQSRRQRLKRWFIARQYRFGWYALFVTILLLLLWPYAVITIEAGHVGVLYRRFLDGTVLDRVYPEGTHLISPWNTMYKFDARIHDELHTFSVLSKSGLLLEIDVTVLYHPFPLQTPVLLTTVGQDYREKLVLPMLLAAVRNVAGQFDQTDFYSKASGRIQDHIHVSMMESMGRNPISIDSVLIRAVRLPANLNQAINEKLVAEQAVFREQFKVQEAQQRYRVKFVDAEAIRMEQEIVNKNMTDEFLRWHGIEATKELARSPNSKFVITGGGRNGLPVILNPDSPSSASGAPTPAEPAKNPPIAERNAPSNVVLPETSENYLQRIDGNTLDAIGKQLRDYLHPAE
ncbi:MAG: prohibitin family protein [Candidatus Accumulibacter sp.]|nr:prohibitin family protein [Accumulibacter sp.]